MINMDLVIRQAGLDDLKTILSLIKLNSDTFSKTEVTEAGKYLMGLISKRNQENDFFVAKVSNKIVGCAGFSKQTDTYGVYCLNWLAVHPDFKRRRIATKLYLFIEACIKKQSGRMIVLDAGSDEANQYFYRKMGFIECGIIPKYHSEKKDMIMYYKPL